MTTEFRPGDKVVVINYPDYADAEEREIIGKTGAVVEAQSIYIAVKIDNLSPELLELNTDIWLFRKDEIEHIVQS